MKKNDYQFSCEVLAVYLINGVRERRWTRREVLNIVNGSQVRCMHCQQPVRIHRQRKLNGPRDHVEHFELNPSCALGEAK